VHALEDVSVAFPAGRFTAIMGPSGSGKSTLMHILAGLDRPTSGSVVLDGIELDASTTRELTSVRASKVGFVFQSFNLLPVLTAEENILLPLSIAGAKPDPAGRRLIDTVGAGDRAHAPPFRAVRRPAAARRDRPRARLAAGRGLRRRADRQPRLEASAELLRPPAPLRRRVRPDVIMVTHDAWRPPTPTACCVLADGRSSTTGPRNRPRPCWT
jgi:putative ABC transport system ATP-binding protein